MIKIIISGAAGKMGVKVRRAAASRGDVKPVCGVDLKSDLKNPDFPVYPSFDDLTKEVGDARKAADVIIDFSAPSALGGVLGFAVKHGVPVVLCTTGYDEKDEERIKAAAEKTAVFRTDNTSAGVYALKRAVKLVAEILGGFDVEIIEKHHNEKKDAPSGTALAIAEVVKSVRKDCYAVYGRNGFTGARDRREIGVHSVRGGNVVGEHQVIFAGNDETVTITHCATDKNVFASGAIDAAVFIADKKSGLYGMEDLFGRLSPQK